MPSLVLHAGFHKTGTSAIQQFAARNRRRLLAGGVLYPRLWPAVGLAGNRPSSGHHALAHALARLPASSTDPSDSDAVFRKARELVQRWVDRADADGCSVLLSSEAICRYGWEENGVGEQGVNTYLERWRKLLSEFDVLPVLVVRRQDDFTRSLYQEHVAAGTGASARLAFSEFLTRAAADKARFLERLEGFRKVFGKVRVLVYEELTGGSLPGSFLQQLDIDGLEGCVAPVVRPSLSVAETLIKQRLNAWILGRWQNRLVLLWLRSAAVRGIVQGELGDCTTLWSDAEVRAAFIEQFDRENARIARDFLGRDGKLFPALHEHASTDVPPPENARVSQTLQRAVKAGGWRLRAILGRQAVEELMRS